MSDAERRCPVCSGELHYGFGLAFGGDTAGYVCCLDCDWFEKGGKSEHGDTVCLPHGLAPHQEPE